MSEFIRLEIDLKRCVGIKECGKCVQVCPVNIFEPKGDQPRVVAESQDECILCEQCLEACAPDAIVLHKLYED
jgi:NAD-dependent dihydropyrimidine dehydrogenase PreA subunit